MKRKSIGFYIIASAIIWGAVILGCSVKLKGTGCYGDVSLILYGGVLFHLLLIWPFMGKKFRENDGGKSEMNH